MDTLVLFAGIMLRPFREKRGQAGPFSLFLLADQGAATLTFP